MNIAPQDARDYNRSLEEWLPAGVRAAANRGDMKAQRLLVVWRNYRAYRKPEDWAEFVALRKTFETRGDKA